MAPSADRRPTAPRRPPGRWGLLLVLALVGACYLPVLSADRFWDDHTLLAEHPALAPGAPLAKSWTTTYWHVPKGGEASARIAYYRPLTVFGLALERRIMEPAEPLHHGVNLALHMAVVALVYVLALRLGATVGPALILAAAFGTATRLTEAVAWISARGDLVAAAGVLGALLCTVPGRRGGGRPLAAAFLLLAALLGKELAVAGAGAVALVRWAQFRSFDPGRRALALWPALVPLAAWAAMRGAVLPASEVALAGPWPGQAAEILAALGTYLGLAATPWGAELMIPPPAGAGRGAAIAAGSIALAAAAAAALRLLGARRWHTLAVAALGAGALLPVLHILALQSENWAADRYLYVPLAAAAALAAAALTRAGRRTRWAVGGALALLVAVQTATTHARARLWQSELALWHHDLSDRPAPSASALRFYAWTLYRAGHLDAAAHHFGQALNAARAAGASPTARDDLRFALATVLSDRGDYGRALALLAPLVGGGAAHADPPKPVHRYNYALLLARMQQFDAARHHLRAALGQAPDYRRAADLAAVVRQARRQWAAAAAAAAAGDPVRANLLRTRARAAVGDVAGAQAELRALVELPGAGPDELAMAAKFLADHGDPAVAAGLADRLAAAGRDELAEELRQRIAERRKHAERGEGLVLR